MGKAKGTTKSQGKKHTEDKFYTKTEVVDECLGILNLLDYDLVIEPSAGNGAFSDKIPGCLAFDINPEAPDILQQDWFEYKRERNPEEKILVVGNPPFGQQNQLALRFINHAAEFADSVAFVLPRSFKKYSVKNRINKHLHLSKEITLPAKAFLLNGEDYGVPCVFQVWEWKEELRPVLERRMSSQYFSFVKKEESPDCRIQRVGGNSGKASSDLDRSAASNYFIKIKAPVNVERFIEYVNSLEFPGREYGVGPRTLSKDELIRVFEKDIPSDFNR